MSKSNQRKQKKDSEVKTFTVPFSLELNNVNISNRTIIDSQLSKEELINKAINLNIKGSINEEAKCYQICLDKGFIDHRIFYNYGILLKKLNKLNEAEIYLRKAIQIKDNFKNIYSFLGEVLKDQGKFDEAKIILKKSIKLNPGNYHDHRNLGGIYFHYGQLEEARIETEQAIKLNPNYEKGYINLGVILRSMKKLKEAEIYTRKAIEINPNYAEAYANLGGILQDIGKLKDSEIYTRKALEINPNQAELYYNLGGILRDIGRLEDSELFLRKAIELKPDFVEAYYNLSFVLIKAKKFLEGFNHYECRWKVRNRKVFMIPKLQTSKPEWTPISKGRVLLWAEQGIGDEILFASLIPDLYERVDQLIIKADERLIPLFKRSFSPRIIYVNNNHSIDEEKYDFHIAMGSLLKFFRNNKEDIKKSKKKYLNVNKEKSNRFRNKIKDLGLNNKIIGISWKSNSTINENKSLSLEQFILGIYSPNVCFVNLQYGDNKFEINNIKEKHNIHIICLEEVDIYNNIDDLAALINACDIVVSIENMLFSLVGAIGIESKILLTRNCLCFNGNTDLHSDWFLEQDFFRQSLSGGWEEALNKIKNEIEIFKQ